MVNFAVFNERSLPFQSRDNLPNKFGEFFKLLAELKGKGLVNIRASGELKNYDVLQGVDFKSFIGKQRDIDFKRKLISFLMNGYIIIDTPLIKKEDTIEHDVINSCEYLYNTESTVGGLACCDVWGTLAISFASAKEWNTSRIPLLKDVLTPDGKIEQKNVFVKHSSTVSHLDDHNIFFDELAKEIRLGITRRNFWSLRESYFPQVVVFCPEVEFQVGKLSKEVFTIAMKILRSVEMKQKKITDYDVSGEGETVCNTPKLMSVRTFTLGDKKVFFEKHVKSLPSKYRIHFIEEPDKVHIGYIGKHLPTKKG